MSDSSALCRCAMTFVSMSFRFPFSSDFLTVLHTNGVARPCDAIRLSTKVDWSSLSNSVQSRATTIFLRDPIT